VRDRPLAAVRFDRLALPLHGVGTRGRSRYSSETEDTGVAENRINDYLASGCRSNRLASIHRSIRLVGWSDLPSRAW
jgi:hypothetical protein